MITTPQPRYIPTTLSKQSRTTTISHHHLNGLRGPIAAKMSNGSTTVTSMPSYTTDDYLSGSAQLSSSIASLSSSRQNQSSQIAKTYRQAAQLFLTRRLPEALSTIEPVITPQQPSDPVYAAEAENDGQAGLAPIASASKTTRSKVWSFYLTFLNSVIDLGPEEGKHAFGSTKWKALVSKARDGSVWEDIVRDGYGGNEGAVDADVVINLATLLLTHGNDQRVTQARLETYLSALSNPTFDVAGHMAAGNGNGPPRMRRTQSASGTNTPRDLHTHLKLLELYTLHCLPRVGEWDYAREFIMMSEVLDDERKESFLHALYGLKEEQENAAKREEELRVKQREELEERRQREEEEARAQEERRVEEDRRREDARRRPQRPPDGTNGSGVKAKAPVGPTSSTSRQPKKDVSRRKQPATLYARAAAMFSTLQSTLMQTAQGLANNPMALLRAILFLLAFALAFGRREIRERVRRLLEKAWEKLKGTVGMGVKVSYI